MAGVPPEIEIRRTLWLFVAAFALHEAEEWNLVSWLNAHFTPSAAFNDFEARVLLAAITVLGVGFAAAVISAFTLRNAVRILLPVFVAPIIANALTHVFWLVYFWSYAPGVVTALLLLIPLGGFLAIRAVRHQFLPAAAAWCLAALALIPPVGAAFAGSTMSEPQLELQRLGARLASWL